MTNLVSEGLLAAGVPVQPLKQGDVPVSLTWNPAQMGPILENRVIVTLPDIHLTTNGDGDIFRQTDASRLGRLEKFLKGLAQVRQQALQQGMRFSVVHLGDFYDVWRAYPEYADHPTADYRRIEDAYGSVIDLMINQLDMRVCVGNHDASMALFPPWWARDQAGATGRLSYAQRYAGGKIVAFHGHQADQVAEVMSSQGGDASVKAATIAAQKLSNPISLLVQQGIDLAIDAFADPELLNEGLLTAGWPKSTTIVDTDGFSCTRWCDRGNAPHTRAVLEHTTFADQLRLVLVGHTHRAGITALQIKNRFVPVIDAGSWVWGHAQFAVAVEGQVSLWML